MCSLTLFIDEKIANHATNMMIINNISQACHQGVPETNSHYLFYCHRFNDSRNRYIESIDIPMNLTVDHLLFGSTDLTHDQNNSLFLNVQKFIINSKRFI